MEVPHRGISLCIPHLGRPYGFRFVRNSRDFLSELAGFSFLGSVRTSRDFVSAGKKSETGEEADLACYCVTRAYRVVCFHGVVLQRNHVCSLTRLKFGP